MIPREYALGEHPFPQDESWSQLYESQEIDSDDARKPSWIGLIAVGILFFLMGIAMIHESPGVGLGFVFFGLILIIGSNSARKWVIDQEESMEADAQWEEEEAARTWQQDIQARQELKQREIDEIVKAVKSTIRVRCRYCGTLNEETANKCESCGGSL